MTAALYLRVSTEEQAREGLSLSVQEQRCREAAFADGAEQVRVFRDDGYSGTTLERPALRELLASLDTVDVVYVWKLDRLSRSNRDTANLLADLAEAGVCIKSVFASFARCSPAYNAVMPVLGPMWPTGRSRSTSRPPSTAGPYARCPLLHTRRSASPAHR